MCSWITKIAKNGGGECRFEKSHIYFVTPKMLHFTDSIFEQYNPWVFRQQMHDYENFEMEKFMKNSYPTDALIVKYFFYSQLFYFIFCMFKKFCTVLCSTVYPTSGLSSIEFCRRCGRVSLFVGKITFFLFNATFVARTIICDAEFLTLRILCADFLVKKQNITFTESISQCIIFWN